MPAAVHDEARGAEHIHALIDARAAMEAARRQQEVGDEDEQCPCPSRHLDEELDRAQAARFRST